MRFKYSRFSCEFDAVTVGLMFKVLMITFNKASGYVPMETMPQLGAN